MNKFRIKAEEHGYKLSETVLDCDSFYVFYALGGDGAPIILVYKDTLKSKELNFIDVTDDLYKKMANGKQVTL